LTFFYGLGKKQECSIGPFLGPKQSGTVLDGFKGFVSSNRV